MPNIICVADLTAWRIFKRIVPPDPSIDRYLSVVTTYIGEYANEDMFTPIGSMIFNLLEYLAWDFTSIRSLVGYMRNMHIEGAGGGTSRQWKSSILSDYTLNNIGKLENGGFWNEWGLGNN